MNDTSDMVHVFSNTELTVTHLKNILEDNGITSLIRNDYESGNAAGFVGGTSTSVDLYIQKVDEEKALPIIEEFKTSLGK
ncbi:putative signal transducing protein [Carboxylicivirga caseinilyticus]|uniref:putative signal transducing protein n=1 Tax=Carboxylicivirga caseinilyticus TaxID=3417572 RepID=UPI002AA68D83|nr:DUF2007 domain-containing protein [uncultured Carboxylicivirga sp.]MCU4163095.1 DUF2007 domain-containing protein [Marinilabiliaceae bacterium A049]